MVHCRSLRWRSLGSRLALTACSSTPTTLVCCPRVVSATTLPAVQRRFASAAKLQLAPVGKFEEVQTATDAYPACKVFFHRVFGYRGIILAHFHASVFDRDLVPAQQTKNANGVPGWPSEVKGLRQNYYLALVDVRDWNFVRSQVQGVTFLANEETNKSVYSIPGMEYVSHEDILPYAPADRVPIRHELFSKFVETSPEDDFTLIPRETLRTWISRNKAWLKVSDVHKETTDNIRVTAIPFYMGCRSNNDTMVYWWRYTIRIENMGSDTVTLRERHWRVFSLSGTLETVKGKGVVGLQPLLDRDAPAFQYSSHVSLTAPSGHMWGEYKMETVDGESFSCKIPAFLLEAAVDSPTDAPTETTANLDPYPN